MAHLAFVVSSLGGGGAERVLATLVNHWARSGHEVTVLTFQAASDDDYELEPTIKRVALDIHGEASSKLDALRRNARRVRVLRSALKAANPDVVVAFATRQSVLAAAAARGLSVPVVGSERNNPERSSFLNPIWRRIMRWGYALPSAIVAVSEGIAEALRQQTKARRVEVIHNPLDERHLTPAPSQPEDAQPDAVHHPDDLVILGLGRLVPQKGFDNLIEAFARIADQRPDWRLVIVGDGPQRDMLTDLVHDAGLGDRVALPGWADDTTPWYQSASIFAFPSRWEGFGVVLIEALSHGLPAVAADCDYGPREILTHGQDGYLVRVDDIDELADRLASLMDDPQLRAGMASHARSVRERYRTPAIAQQWEKLFFDLGVSLNA